MKNYRCYFTYFILMVILNTSCDKDSANSFGQISAIIDGKAVEFTPDIAKVYAGIDLQEFGANTFFDSVGISNIVDRDEI